jgi:hypothetical protein
MTDTLRPQATVAPEEIYEGILYDASELIPIATVGVVLGTDIDALIFDRFQRDPEVPTCQDGCCMNYAGIGEWKGTILKLFVTPSYAEDTLMAMEMSWRRAQEGN